MLTPEQLIAAHKAQVDTLFGLASKAFEGVEKLAALNLQHARSTLADGAQQAQAALSAKDAQQWLALQTSLLQPTAEKAAAYRQQLMDLAGSAQADYVQAAQAQWNAAQQQFQAAWARALQQAGAAAPAGAGQALDLMNTAMAAATATYEQVQQAVHKATGKAGRR